MKLWSGRFEKATNELLDDFNSSLPFDIKLYKQDIAGSIAHATMLSKCNIISELECQQIIDELKNLESKIEDGTLSFDNSEDVHMFIESKLTAKIGEAGKKLHTARSRNDQVATDFKLYIRESNSNILVLIKDLIAALYNISLSNTKTIMPGFTHLQSAQPITLAHHLLAYCEMFLRDSDRFKTAQKRLNTGSPLGSCALAGTTFNIDRHYTAKLLGFDDPCANSLDGVSDRDFALDYLYNCSVIAMHMSRLCEEIIIWNTSQFKFIELDDSFSTGSSIMPQKKNPDPAELIRGKTGRIYGNLQSLLVTLKGLPLAYNKDMQEDKEVVFDTEKNITLSLKVLIGMLTTAKFNKKQMLKNAIEGYSNATDIADYLVKKLIPFRTAHEISGKIVLDCIKSNKTIESLSLEDFNIYSNKFDEDVLEAVKLANVVNNRKSFGGPSPEAVKMHLKSIKKQLSKF